MQEITADPIEMHIQGNYVLCFYLPKNRKSSSFLTTYEEISNEINGIVFFRIDINHNEAMTSKYNIKYAPHLVLFSGDKVIGDLAGSGEKNDTIKKIHSIFQR